MMDREEQKLRKYLTGDLSEAEQLKIEAEFLASDEAFERLEEIENDLVDEYVRGELTAQERSLFEKNYLTTPLHRQRVLLSQNLLRTAAKEKIPAKNKAAASSTSWWSELFSGLKLHQLAWAVAALLIAVLGGWFLLRPPPATVTNPEIAKAEATPPMASPTPEPQPSKLNIPKPETRIPTPVFLLRGAFNINQTRGLGTKGKEAAKTQSLVLEKGVEKVTLQMLLEGERYVKYQSEIRAIDTSKSFTLITKPPVKSAKNISLTIPAARLAKADYVLTLSGVTETGEIEEINQYPFRVTRR
jgi:hypothetical protein